MYPRRVCDRWIYRIPLSMVTHALPGGELIDEGVSDLAAGRESIAAVLVSIGAPRLRALGMALPNIVPGAERRLYEMLAAENEDAAHGRYNALVRRLVAYERAMACVHQ